MKRTNLRASVFCLATIAASFVSAQNLPVDLAGNVAGVAPSVRLTKLIGSDLKSQNGESLGRVQDLILDPVTGQAQFAILSAGASGSSTTGGIATTPGTTGTTAMGQFVAIPWRLMSSSAQGQYVANVDRAQLQSAPTFSSSSWPTLDATWMRSVDSHYGLNGTSMGRPGSSSGTETGTGTGIQNSATPGSLNRPGAPRGLRTSPSATPHSGTGTGSGTSGAGSGGTGSSGGGK